MSDPPLAEKPIPRTIRRASLVAILGLAGFSLYVVPALRAPIVRWGDSETDLRWAREGIGLWKPFTAEDARTVSVHSYKPGYLLFLRLASTIYPSNPERSVVFSQSLLLWSAIAASCFALGRRIRFAVGATAYVLLALFIPIRDSGSAIMPEAICTAALLPLCRYVWETPSRCRPIIVGICLLALFSIRPNVGAVMFLIIALGWSLQRAWRRAALLGAIFFSGMLVLGFVTYRYAGREARRALSYAILVGSAEYNWTPSLPVGPEATLSRDPGVSRLVRSRLDPRLSSAIENWADLFRRPTADLLRDLAWRMFHGFFGLDYYDASWSDWYRPLERLSRLYVPIIALLALAIGLGAGLLRSSSRSLTGASAFTLVILLVLHNLLFSSSPRLLLPLIPLLLLLSIRALWISARRLLVPSGVVLMLGVVLLRIDPQVASWDWGVIESAGAVIEQEIAAGSLPRGIPATFHLRVLPQPAPAGLVISLNGRSLWRSSGQAARPSCVVAADLPPSILEENAHGPITLRVASEGHYDPHSFFLFPVLPPLWRSGARRLDAAVLSPRSDIPSGSLDWWAHPGADTGGERRAFGRGE